MLSSPVGSIPLALNAKHALYNKLVYSSIMEVFGGHVEYAVSGGAPLDSSIAHFFNGVGLPLLEGYGMTETCGPLERQSDRRLQDRHHRLASARRDHGGRRRRGAVHKEPCRMRRIPQQS